MEEDNLIAEVHPFLEYEPPVPTNICEEEDQNESADFISDNIYSPDQKLVDYVTEYKNCQKDEPPDPMKTKEFLRLIFPVRYLKVGGVHCQKIVSAKPATREKLLGMMKAVDSILEKQKPRANGVCPIRHHMHMQFFEELIRQVSTENKLRGYLLVRIMGEYAMTLEAYKTVVKVSEAEESKNAYSEDLSEEVNEYKEKIDQLQEEISALQKTKSGLEQEYNIKVQEFEDLVQENSEGNSPSIQFLLKIKEQYESQLNYFQTPPAFEEYLPPEEDKIQLI